MIKAPLIFKIKFTLPNKEVGNKNAAHIKYIATRPGVEKYTSIENEQEFDKHLDVGFSNDEVYAKYMHERPGSHGLFGPDEKQPDLLHVQKELQSHKGIVWRAVVSLREDDANYLGYIEKEKWQQSLRSRMPEISQEMGINESNLKWVAAFHQAKGHPHVHIVFWEKEPLRSKGKLSKYEMRNIKRTLTREFYREERERLGKVKNEIRKYVLEKSKGDLDLAAEISKQISKNKEEIMAIEGKKVGVPPRLYETQEKELAYKLYKLAEIIPGKGRMALKFMPENVKEEARATAAWILAQPGFKKETVKFIETAEKFSRHYTMHEEQIKEAGNKAYQDLRDRVAQEIIRKAGTIQSMNFERKINIVNKAWKSVWEVVKREQIKQEMEAVISRRKLQQKLDRAAEFENT